MSAANVLIDSSQFPEQVRRDLVDSLRSRQINHKFHYDSYKQAQKWLALHEAYSPARNDADCLRIYDDAFRAAVNQTGNDVHVIGLGCGGGQKEAALLKLLKERGSAIAYSPSDVSLALVLTARTNASGLVDETRCLPVVCDLVEAGDLERLFARKDSNASRVITFFGMIPNFEPDAIVPKLRSLLRPTDILLFSANLAPGVDYASGVQRIVSQYDNELTKEWLLTLLLDLGIERTDGQVRFSIEENKAGYRRVVGNFVFNRTREIRLGSEQFVFEQGSRVRLFFSYRYQPRHIVELLRGQGIDVVNQFVTTSGEEGVFVCRLAAR
jgi:L-histidine N-alpha-methyltransferase